MVSLEDITSHATQQHNGKTIESRSRRFEARFQISEEAESYPMNVVKCENHTFLLLLSSANGQYHSWLHAVSNGGSRRRELKVLMSVAKTGSEHEIFSSLGRVFSCDESDAAGKHSGEMLWFSVYELSIEQELCRKVRLADFTVSCYIVEDTEDKTFNQEMINVVKLMDAMDVGNFARVAWLLQDPQTELEFYKSEGQTPLHVAADGGLDELARVLVDCPHVQVNRMMHFTNTRSTALFTACEKGHSVVVSHLLGHAQIDVNKSRVPDGATPLVIAYQNGHFDVVGLLLTHSDIDVNQSRPTDGATLLLLASHEGCAETVQLLLKSPKIDVNGATPLLIACQNRHLDVVRLLLTHSDIDVNQSRPADGATPLFLASQEGCAETVQLLLESPKIDVNVMSKSVGSSLDKKGSTPLLAACQNGHAQVVALLLARDDTDVNKVKDYTLSSPVYMASKNGHLEVVRLLLISPKTDATRRNKYGRNAFDIAKEKGHSEILKLLKSRRGKAKVTFPADPVIVIEGETIHEEGATSADSLSITVAESVAVRSGQAWCCGRARNIFGQNSCKIMLILISFAFLAFAFHAWMPREIWHYP